MPHHPVLRDEFSDLMNGTVWKPKGLNRRATNPLMTPAIADPMLHPRLRLPFRSAGF